MEESSPRHLCRHLRSEEELRSLSRPLEQASRDSCGSSRHGPGPPATQGPLVMGQCGTYDCSQWSQTCRSKHLIFYIILFQIGRIQKHRTWVHSAWVLFNIMFMTQGQLGIYSRDRVTWPAAHQDPHSPSPPPCADKSQGAPIKQVWDSVHLQVFRALVKWIPKAAASPGNSNSGGGWVRVGGSGWAPKCWLSLVLV